VKTYLTLGVYFIWCDANANSVAQPLASVKSDPGIYPTPELLPKLTVQLADSDDQTRAITRVWEKFKTGQ
jgi:putrescine transport system substrate-binding protein